MDAESVVDKGSTDNFDKKAVKTIDIFIDSNPRFYYVSDIHLELRKKPPKDLIETILGGAPNADHIRRSVLLLAGDVGCPSEITYELFLQKCEAFFAYVIVIAGNHEYYSSNTKQHTVRTINRELVKVCGRSKVILLGAGDNDSSAVRVDIYSRDGGMSSEGSAESSLEGGFSAMCSGGLFDSTLCDSTLCDSTLCDSTSKCVSTPQAPTHVSNLKRHDIHIDVSSVDLNANSVQSAIYAMSNSGKIYDSKLVARVVGCTLWSAATETAAVYMNDYRRIYVEGYADRAPKEGLMRMDFMAPTRTRLRHGVRNLNTNDVYYGMHQPQCEFLKSEIAIAGRDEIPLVVMTHHLPTYELLAEKNTASECYATDLTSLITSPVIAWICGHTHRSMIKEINGVYCGINCYGYPTQKPSDTNFTSMYFEIVDDKVISTAK